MAAVAADEKSSSFVLRGCHYAVTYWAWYNLNRLHPFSLYSLCTAPATRHFQDAQDEKDRPALGQSSMAGSFQSPGRVTYSDMSLGTLA